jgi:hypothetical protein
MIIRYCLTFRRLCLVVFAACIVVALSGCSLPPDYLVLEGKGDIAIVSFSLDRSLTADTDSLLDKGPALLASTQEKAAYWDQHQKAIDAMYAQFKEHISEALLGAPIFDPKKIEGNEAYLTKTAHVPKVILGQDVAIGWRDIPATGTHYVSAFGKPLLDSLCDMLGVSLVLCVANSAKYHVVDSVRIDTLWDDRRASWKIKKTPLGHVVLTVEAYLHEKGKGMVWSRTYNRLKPKRLVDLFPEDKSMNKSDFASQLCDALEGIYKEIKDDAKVGKEYAAQQATTKQK